MRACGIGLVVVSAGRPSGIVRGGDFTAGAICVEGEAGTGEGVGEGFGFIGGGTGSGIGAGIDGCGAGEVLGTVTAGTVGLVVWL